MSKDLCREHGIGPATFNRWRRKSGEMEVTDAQTVRRLEDENRRLKELVADLTLDKKTLEYMLSKKGLRPRQKRRLAHLATADLGSAG